MMNEQQNVEPAEPLKILFCIDNLVRGGTELQLIGLIERLDPKRFAPYLLTIRESDPELTPKNCHHLAWDVPQLLNVGGLQAVLRLRRWLQKERIDIVQTFFQDSTTLAGLAAKLAATPVRIACFRDLAFWSNRKQALLMRISYRLMTAYISNAEVVKQHFSKEFGVPLNKVRVLPNGVEVATLPFIEHSGPVTDIGIVGNMTRAVKRTDLFIRAAGIVARKHPEITWHIIGDGHMRPELEALALECGVGEQVKFVGRIDDVAKYLEKLQIGVICSDSEGLSNALLEYMFKGAVSVATNVGGNPELVEHQITGLLVPPGRSRALASALESIIENPDLRECLTKAARLGVEAQYSWEKSLLAHEEFYFSQLGLAKRKMSTKA